jgi:GcrA cell cycle regulator
MKNYAITWSEADVAKLKMLWGQGLSASKISAAFDKRFSRNAVIGKVHRLNLVGRPPRPKAAPREAPKVVRPSVAPVVRAVRKSIPAIVSAPTSKNLAIDSLSGKTCRWPIGESDFTFCGKTPRDGSPYCEFHAGRAYAPKGVAQ